MDKYIEIDDNNVMPTHEQTPHYGYASQDGLEVDIHGVYPLKTTQHIIVPPSEIPHLDRSDESWRRVSSAIENPRHEAELGFVLVPPADGNDDGTLEVFQYPWGGNSSNPVGINELAAYAAAHPRHTIAAIDSPATGASEPLSSAISREIGRTGSYFAYGEVAVRALESVLIDYDRHLFSGASEGARRSISTAAAMGEMLDISTAELHLLDPVGTHDQPLLELAKGFGSLEAGHSASYTAASPDKEAAADQATLDSPANVARVLANFALHGGLINQFYREPQAMAKGGMHNDLARAIPHVTELVRISSPELSELTRPRDARDILEALTYTHPTLFLPQLVIEHRVIRNQTHAMTAGHPGVLGVIL